MQGVDMAESMIIIPSAQRLVGSLRDVGYDLATAVADLVDNSVEADATEVRIDFCFAGADSWVRITDNGRGMSSDEIDEAFRYGTRRSYSDRDLGRYGLGLKMASFSQCRRFTVAARTEADAGHMEIRCWDLDHIDQTDAWEALRLTEEECKLECLELIGSSGTVVMWERLDRILGYKDSSSCWAKDALSRLCRETEQHLAMVFHRFLAGEASREIPLRIFLNGNAIEPWDPFARSEPETKSFEPQDIDFGQNGRLLTARVMPYILPNDSAFSSPRARAEAAGPHKWNRQQGLYIYRADRMIQSGGWNRLRTMDEHTKLARIALDFSPTADAAFKTNVAKMSVQIPDEIRNDLTAIASAVARVANNVYRQRATTQPRDPGSPTRTARPSGAGGTGYSDSSKPGIAEPTTPGAYGTGPIGAQGPEPTSNGGQHHETDCRLAREVVRILRRELADQPDVLSRLLGALTEISDEFLEEMNGNDGGSL
jgi:hypothetical protein